MNDSAKNKEISDICHIMDLQVSRHLNIVQAEKYWRHVIEKVDQGVLAEALSEGLPRYRMRSADRSQPTNTAETDYLPCHVKNVCLGLVTSRMIQLRRYVPPQQAESELKTLAPVAEWLLEEGNQK